MRFPRNAKIFRGQLDAAPLAGVFFLLLIFLLLTSLIYTPGVLVRISSGASQTADNRKEILITRAGEVVFEERTYATNMLAQLQADLKRLPPQTVLVMSEAANAPRERVNQIREWARTFEFGFEAPGVAIQPPAIQSISSVEGRTAVVAVNVAGNFFFENQMIGEQKLQTRLTELAAQNDSPFTLIILADKSVEYGLVLRLTQVAESAGIKDVLLQGQPTTAKPSR